MKRPSRGPAVGAIARDEPLTTETPVPCRSNQRTVVGLPDIAMSPPSPAFAELPCADSDNGPAGAP